MKYLAFLLCLLCSACSLFNIEKPEQRILLTVPNTLTTFTPKANSVSLATLSVNPVLDSSTVVVVSDNLLTKLKGAIWADNLSVMMQYILLNTLRKSMLFTSISTDSEGIIANYTIQNTLTDWYIIRKDKRDYAVRASLYTNVVQKHTNAIIAQHSWTFEQKLHAFSTYEIKKTFQTLLDTITTQWLEWLNTTIQ